MRKFLLALSLLLCASVTANAQAPILWGLNAPYGGSTTAITPTGYAAASGSLFLTPATKLGFNAPYSFAYWVKGSGYSQATALVLDARAGGSSIGFASGSYFAGNNGFVWQTLGVAANNSACSFKGESCLRLNGINDNNWHLVCYTFSGTTGIVNSYLDGGITYKDYNAQPNFGTNYVAATGFWQLWSGTQPANVAVRDMWVWTGIIPQNQCLTQYKLGVAGKSPTGAPFTTNLVAHWPFNNCTNVGTSTASCPDSTASPANWTADTTPTVAMTVPSNGATGLSGSVTVTATCTDSVGVKSITVFIDGTAQNTSNSSPNSFAWDSTKFIDGSHSFYAICTNAGSNNAISSTITASTSNSVSAKTVYMDPTSGTDCPSHTGLSTGSPCSTLAGVMSIINSNPLHGGDSILIQHGTNLNITDMTAASVLVLCGPSGYALNAGCTQNVYPGATITVGTYGGTGQCTILAGTTTDCATITLSANGAVPAFAAMVNVSNVPNLIVENLRLIGNQPNAIVTGCTYNSVGCSYGIIYGTANGYFNGGPTNTTSIQNNEIYGFTDGLVLYNTMAPTYPTSGTMCNPTAQNNYVHQPLISTPTSYAINLIGDNCAGSLVNTITGGTLLSNYVNNYGGLAGNDLTGVGYETTTSVNFVENFNVASNIAYNMNTCGAGYGMEWYQTKIGIVKGNESFNVSPSSGTGCDNGAFDLDLGVNTITMNYNYGHETWGPSINLLGGTVGSYVQGTFTTAYNILEDGTAQTSNQNGSLTGVAAETGYYNFYNNNLWNGYNGTTVSPNAFVTRIAAFSLGGCPPSGAIIANNILVSNSAAGVSAEYFYGGDPAVFPTCAAGQVKFLTNNYHPVGTNTGQQLWRSVNTFGDAITSLATWNTDVSANDINVDPQFSGTGGTAVVCYTALSGVPAQPGSIGCPAWAVLAGGSAMIGVGTDLTQAPYSLTLPATDYFTNTIPNGVGTGYNIGADGGNP